MRKDKVAADLIGDDERSGDFDVTDFEIIGDELSDTHIGSRSRTTDWSVRMPIPWRPVGKTTVSKLVIAKRSCASETFEARRIIDGSFESKGRNRAKSGTVIIRRQT